MKILYVVPGLSEKGGIQNFALEQAAALKSHYRIVLSDWNSPINILHKLTLRHVLPLLMAKKYFCHIYKGGMISETNFNDYPIICFWHIDIAIAYPEIRGQIIVCYGGEVLEAHVNDYRRDAFLAAFKRAGAIVTCSKFTQMYIMQHYGIQKDKIHVINPGVDIKSFQCTPRQRRAGVPIIIGTLTRLVARKNVLNVIRAVKYLNENYDGDFVYYLAGDGPEKLTILKELKASGIEYRYFGEISEEEKRDVFYPSLDVFVLPPTESATDVEGFGIVFLEANASGVPVVAARTGGVSDAVKLKVSGIFADPTNVEDIAQKINKILTDRNNWQISTRTWAERFDQKQVAAAFQRLYEQLIENQQLLTKNQR